MPLYTQQEWDDRDALHHNRVKVLNVQLQELCTKVACLESITRPWAPNEQPTPWGCILVKDKRHCGYCDCCPVQDVCPYQFKEWSK